MLWIIQFESHVSNIHFFFTFLNKESLSQRPRTKHALLIKHSLFAQFFFNSSVVFFTVQILSVFGYPNILKYLHSHQKLHSSLLGNRESPRSVVKATGLKNIWQISVYLHTSRNFSQRCRKAVRA